MRLNSAPVNSPVNRTNLKLSSCGSLEDHSCDTYSLRKYQDPEPHSTASILMHHLKRKNRGAKPLGQAQATATPGNSSTTSIPTLNVPNPSTMERIRDGAVSIFGFTSRRSSRAPSPAPPPSPANLTQTGPLKLGEPLQQEASDLWTKAYDELPIKYQQDLGGVDKTDSDKPEKLDALKKLLERAMEAKKENTESQWKVKWGDREINVREKAEKLVGWITKFREIGDIVVQYDPVHAALPWAGIRSILIACPLPVDHSLHPKPLHPIHLRYQFIE